MQAVLNNDEMISGAVSGDMAIRSQSKMLFATGGNTQRFKIDASGNATFENTVLTRDTFKVYKSGATSQNTYTATAGLQLHSQQSDSGSPYTKTSDIVANGDSTVPSELRIFTKANGASSPSQRMVIKGDGQVGVGVNDPDGVFQVRQTNDTVSNILSNGDYGIILEGHDSGSAGEAVGLFLSGKTVGSSPLRGVALLGEIQSTGNDHDLIIATSEAGSIPAERVRIDSKGTTTIKTDGTEQLILNRADSSIFANNTIGTIKVTADDPSVGQIGGQIQFTGGGTWSENNYPTNIVFSSDTSGTLTEKMRLTDYGDLGLGTDNPTNSNNYKTLDIRGTSGGQIILGRTDMDFFLYTTSSSSHIGTGTGQDLIFHTDSSGSSNQRFIIRSNGDVYNYQSQNKANTYYGYLCGNYNGTGASHTAMGYDALTNVSTGTSNTGNRKKCR